MLFRGSEQFNLPPWPYWIRLIVIIMSYMPSLKWNQINFDIQFWKQCCSVMRDWREFQQCIIPKHNGHTYHESMTIHRRRNRGGWGGGGPPPPPPQSKMWGAPPPCNHGWKTLILWIFNDIFNYDFSSFYFALFVCFLFKLISYRPCCDFHPISVNLSSFFFFRSAVGIAVRAISYMR